MLSILSRFWRNERGNFAIIFSLSAIPVLGIAGIALDYSRISAAEDRLQAAVDAGLLAAATEAGSRTSDMQLLAAGFIEANMGDVPVEVNTTIDSHKIRIVAKHELVLPVLAAIGKPVTEIAAEGELVSAAPLKSNGVAIPRLSPDQRRTLWRRFDRITKGLPHHERIRLRHKLEASLKASSGGFYLSK